MTKKTPRLPYFDALLNLLDQDYPALERTFGRHVHWGYWENPAQGCPTPEDFAQAAERLTRIVYASAHVGDGQRVLDVGCGFGGTVASMNEQCRDMELVGLNIDGRQLERASRQVVPAGANSLDWVKANACSLPFKDEAFDAVLAVECIFHFPDRRRFFDEAWRVLKPGARLALSDFLSTNGLRPWTYLASHWPSSIGFYGRCDVQYNFERYRQLARKTGFAIRQELDITKNTLPTYAFLRNLRHQIPFSNRSAILETLFAEWASRAGLLRYAVLGFEKPG